CARRTRPETGSQRSPAYKRFTDAIRASAPDLNITFEWRSVEGKKELYPQILTELVEQQVDVVFTGPTPAAVAAKQVTAMVAIVFMIVANPVTLGLVKNLEKPGHHRPLRRTARFPEQGSRSFLSGAWTLSNSILSEASFSRVATSRA